MQIPLCLLEQEVECYRVGIARIGCIVSLSCKCVFTVENYVLFQGYISHCIPESYVGSAILGECQECAGGETGAAEVNISVNIVICHIKLPGSRSLRIYVAIAETCIPCSVIVGRGGGVLPVFTEYTEVVERNVEGSSQQFYNGPLV